MINRESELGEVKEKLRNFYFKITDPTEFEKWVYQHESLEGILGHELYLKLVSVDFSRCKFPKAAADVICVAYEQRLNGDLFRDRVRDVLVGMLEGTVSLRDGCQELWKYQLEGQRFIPIVFAGYATELENAEHESFYRDRVLVDARDLLEKLST